MQTSKPRWQSTAGECVLVIWSHCEFDLTLVYDAKHGGVGPFIWDRLFFFFFFRESMYGDLREQCCVNVV